MSQTIITIVTSVLSATGIAGLLTSAFIARLKKEKEENNAIRLGVQALLRHELYEMHDKYARDNQCASLAVKEDFQNMYDRYHALGANGVMDGVHDEFMKLSTQTTKPDGDKNEH